MDWLVRGGAKEVWGRGAQGVSTGFACAGQNEHGKLQHVTAHERNLDDEVTHQLIGTRQISHLSHPTCCPATEDTALAKS